MKTLSFFLAVSLALAPALYAQKGIHGGGGGRGGGGGEGRRGGEFHGEGRGGGDRPGGRGDRGGPARKNGHWQHHQGTHNGKGNWSSHNHNGNTYNTWNGPYYYAGPGWYMGGLFLVGFTFYTCTVLAVASTHTWVVSSDDIGTYNSWPNQDKVSVMQVEDDSEWPYRLCYDNGSCVKARPAPN